jgi:hypothetical protein
MKLIQDRLAVLINQPMHSIFRESDEVFIDFGELVERDLWDFNEEKVKVCVGRGMIGKHTLDIECSFRFVCGDQVVIARSDIYQPTNEREANADFDWNSFDWDVRGGNRYEELVSKYFAADSPKFVVKKVTVNQYGDLKITYTNGFALDVFLESAEQECWRFFESGESDNHLVITGRGLAKDQE